MTGWRYRLYGLEVSSEIELGRLPPGDPAAAVDVRIKAGGVPETLPDPIQGCEWFQGNAEAILLDLPGAGRFLVTGGNRICAEQVVAGSAALRWRLLGIAFGAILHQRGVLPLHATVVAAVPGQRAQGVGLIGASGTGKSTLAAGLARAGHTVLIDDVCAMWIEDNRAMAEAGNGMTRLWGDAMVALALSGGEALEGRPGKFEVPVAQPDGEPTRLRALIAIVDGETTAMTRLDANDRLRLCIANTYVRDFLPCTGGAARNFRQCAALAQAVPVYRLARPRRFEALGDVVATVSRELEALLCQTA